MLLLFALFACTLATHSTKALEIHIFNVGAADSQLVVFPSGYSILIDCGDRDKDNASNTKHIAKRVEAILGKKKIDVFVLTHYHIDHAGVKGKNGAWYLLEKKGFTFGKFLKRDAGSYSGSDLSDCSKSKIKWKYAGEMTSEMAKFICYAVSSKDTTKLSKIAKTISRCSTSQITPSDKGAKVTVIMKDALGVKSEDSGNAVSRNSVSSSTPVAENDFSICMRIEYQKFVYATCGDLTGDTKEENGHKFHNIETTVAPMMGEVDLYHVNHHGSDTSTNKKWADTLKPTVSVVSCGNDALPNTIPMQNLKNVGSKVYTTGDNCKQSVINAFSNIIEMGDDIVISVPTDGTKFTIKTAGGKKSKSFTIKTSKKAASKCKKLDE